MRTSHDPALAPGLPTPYECVPPHYIKCFPEYLRAAGYFCTNNLKTDYQFAPPFTAWDECDASAHWRQRPDSDQPFFAVFNPTLTHESGMWPRADEQLETDLDALEVPPYLPDTVAVRQTIARQYDNIARSDRIVGELLQQLAEDGLESNTVVMLWSDHGEGLPRGKRWPYDRGIRVPLIVRWPGQLESGSCDERLVSLVDLAPTLLSLAAVEAPLHFQGVPFLGAEAQEREYIFATRDRHDEFYDMTRAVRDRRWKYLRHFNVGAPYLPWNDYRNRHPAMQEIWRLHAQNALVGAQKLLLQPRPAEELYDTKNDPWELNNLAHDANCAPELERLRAALGEWRSEFGDRGEQDETQMVEQMWPDFEQPITSAPQFIVLGPNQPGTSAANQGGRFEHPALLQLYCATQGASLGYRFDDNARWHLYTEPLRLPRGITRVSAKAIRIGYKESELQTAAFEVT